ncbi:MAG: nucleotidyltransferase family protein [Actinomycetota bacterium]|nr:nucleotidyltransferase family protein [Actinomycetota bacterium]
MTDAGGFSPDLLAVARTLGLDRAAVLAIDRLTASGIPSILLKGAAIASWLYDDGEARPYVDVDLLVSPRQLEPAKAALADLGYLDRLAGADPAEFGLKEQELFGPDNVCVDLHHGLIGVTIPPARCWDLLTSHTAMMAISFGSWVPVLDIPARTMHLALHAAQNGPVDRKALTDLERGLTRLSPDDWRQASILAQDLGADQAFAAGLRLLPAGRAMADHLSLTRGMSVELALRSGSAPQNAIFLERVASTPGLRRKATLVARKLFPTSAYLRARSPEVGARALVRAWSSHFNDIARRLGPSLVAWRRARSAVRPD